MVTTLPLIFAAWNRLPRFRLRWFLLFIAMSGSLVGVLMGASRSHFLVAAVLILAAALAGNARPVERVAWFTAIVGLAILAMSNERFQRFQSLGDRDMVLERVGGSVNRTFLEILTEYPMGNGLGGGGTSIPYFLQGAVKIPIAMENEYARIVLEQGLIGFLLWISFIWWALGRRTAFGQNPWSTGRKMAWFCCACYFGTGMIGIGLLTAIPQSLIFLLLIGWIAVPQNRDEPIPPNAVSLPAVLMSPSGFGMKLDSRGAIPGEGCC
jgi:hypothetical protein